MWRSWKFWLVLVAISGVVGLFVYGFTVDPKLVKSPLLGKPAPGFAITRIGSGERLTLGDLRGKPLILNFWASWCAACREEAHVLQATHTLYEEQQQKVRVVGIAIQDTESKAMAFARKFGKTYFLALDDDAGDISLSYGIYGVPETFFIDAEGIIRYKQVGPVTPEVIEQQVESLLAESGKAAS